MLDPVKNAFTIAGLRALITKIVGGLSSKVAKTDVVSSWQSTPDNSHVPSEKLVRDTIDNLTPADVGAATAEQGAKADSAVQPGDLGSLANKDSVALGGTDVTGTLPVSKGGTGADTIVGARTALDVYSKTETESLLNGMVVILSTLPTTGEENKVYYIGPSGSGDDQYEEYLWDSTNSQFIKVGERSVDLSDYLQKDGDGDDVTSTPTTESDYTKPVAATKLSVLFGKLWKFIASVGSAAFKDAGAANGVASLDSNGDVPVSQLPTASSIADGDTTHVPTADAVDNFVSTGSFPGMTAGIAPRQFPYRTGTTTIGGRTYSTVIIGNQEWLSENLQYNDGGTGIAAASTSGNPFIGQIFYQKTAMTRINAALTDGWHVPSNAEYDILQNNIGINISGTLLKSTSLWGNSKNGKNYYGFNVWPCGRLTSAGADSNYGWNAYLWINNSNRLLAFTTESDATYFVDDASYYASIRLVRNTSSNISDLPAVGSSSQPVYVASDGSFKSCDVGTEFFIDRSPKPDGANYYVYYTIAWTGVESNGGLSNITLEIGPLGADFYASPTMNGKYIVTLHSYGGNNKANVLIINMDGVIPSNMEFLTHVADGKLYLDVKMYAYKLGAYVKVTSHGKNQPYGAGILYYGRTAPTGATISNVTYQQLSVM